MALNRAGSNSSSNCISARFAGHVRELDLIHIDMPPAAFLLIHDLDMGGLALEAAHVPDGGRKLLVVFAGGRAHDLAVQHQPDLRVGVSARRPPGTG